MERFFVGPSSITGDTLLITGEDVHHMSHVLRLHAGDIVCICDGERNEYLSRILLMDKQRVALSIGQRGECAAEPPYRVTLYQGIPKSGKMEAIIQKCVELGVSAIRPTVTGRCVVRVDEGFEKKILRYQRVANEAAKQCGRGILPRVLPALPLADCPWQSHELVICAYEEEKAVALKQALSGGQAKDIAVVVGPEGGFSPEEAAYMKGFAVLAGLGRRILRTETAGMAALAMLAYAWEM